MFYFNDDELQQYQNTDIEAKASVSWSSLQHKDFGDSGDSLDKTRQDFFLPYYKFT